MAVQMELSRILIRELNDYQLIELREVLPEQDQSEELDSLIDEGEQKARGRSFPIVIGLPEAQAIDRRLKGIPIKRPQTHDLLANLIDELGAELRSITINDLSDHTFYATLDIEKEGVMLHVDSRPSDAIALGIAGDVPIYVEEHVLEAALTDQPE